MNNLSKIENILNKKIEEMTLSEFFQITEIEEIKSLLNLETINSIIDAIKERDETIGKIIFSTVNYMQNASSIIRFFMHANELSDEAFESEVKKFLKSSDPSFVLLVFEATNNLNINFEEFELEIKTAVENLIKEIQEINVCKEASETVKNLLDLIYYAEDAFFQLYEKNIVSSESREALKNELEKFYNFTGINEALMTISEDEKLPEEIGCLDITKLRKE